jgi:hypothetical protein
LLGDGDNELIALALEGLEEGPRGLGICAAEIATERLPEFLDQLFKTRLLLFVWNLDVDVPRSVESERSEVVTVAQYRTLTRSCLLADGGPLYGIE